ncbi:MAG: hypothetical protein H7837_08800 [Magnetococcus sp. MYC-9]
MWKKLTQAVSQLASGGAPEKKPEKKAFIPPIQGETTEGSDDNILTNEYKIIEMLMDVVDRKSEVLLTFGSKVLVYKTHLLPDKESGASGGSEPSSEYIRDRKYLLMGPTDPQEGVIKLQNGHPATLAFAYGGRFNEFSTGLLQSDVIFDVAKRGSASAPAGPVPLKRPGVPSAPSPRPLPPAAGPAMVRRPGMPPGALPEASAAGMGVPAGPFKLTFPDTIFRKRRQRNSVRIKYFDEARVLLQVRREAGYSFPAPILDIGVGGVCFAFPIDEAAIAEGSELEATFQWAEGQEVTTRGTLLKMGTRQGKVSGQMSFANDSYEVIRGLGEMVSHVERIRLQARSNKH